MMESFKASSILLTEEKQAIHEALTSSAPLDSDAQQALLRELQDMVSGEESGYFSVCHHHEEEAEHPLTPYVTDSGCLHPLRPYARDSEYFLQTQACKLGPACKYNHILQTNQSLKEEAKKKASSDQTRKDLCKEPEDFHPAMQRDSCIWCNHKFHHVGPTTTRDYGPYNPFLCDNMSSLEPRDYYRGNAISEPSFPQHEAILQGDKNRIGTASLGSNDEMSRGQDSESSIRLIDVNPEELTHRHGQPKSAYHTGTGYCKFTGYCPYRHPGTRTPIAISRAMNNGNQLVTSVPERKLCCNYLYGFCKYRSDCPFKHPGKVEVYGNVLDLEATPGSISAPSQDSSSMGIS